MKNLRFKLFTVLPALLLATPSFAGQWTVGFAGSATVTTPSGSYNPFVGDEPGTTEAHLGEGGAFTEYVMNGSSVSTSWNGPIYPTLQWHPSSPSDLPPVNISVKVFAGASFPSLWKPQNDNSVITFSMNNGWESYTNQTVDGLSASPFLFGKWHIVNYENTSRSSQVNLPSTTLSIQASLPGNAASIGQMRGFEAYAVYDVYLDNRSVKLARGGRFEHSELQNGEWHTYGDSLYSADSQVSIVNDLNNYININTNYTGGWHKTLGGLNWDITPTWTNNSPTAALEPLMTQDNERLSGYAVRGVPTLDFVGYHRGNPTGDNTYNLTYNAKDNVDDATGKAHFHLTLHDPAELLNEGEITSTYTIYSPLKSGSQVISFSGPRDKDTPESTVKVGESTEVGYDLTATLNANPIKDLIGFSAEANITSTKTLSIDTEAKVPAIGAGKLVYVIVRHKFQRTHSRFLSYDTQGRVPRMVTLNSSGATYNPPIEMYHEAFRDQVISTDYEWSDELADTTQVNSIPTTPRPPLEYDFSGDVS